MHATLQGVIVFVIVATATSYASLKFMPAVWRKSLAARVAGWAVRSGLSDVHARRVEAKLSSGGACGSCDSCKACATPTKEGGDATLVAAPPSSSFRSIPIRRV